MMAICGERKKKKRVHLCAHENKWRTNHCKRGDKRHTRRRPPPVCLKKKSALVFALKQYDAITAIWGPSLVFLRSRILVFSSLCCFSAYFSESSQFALTVLTSPLAVTVSVSTNVTFPIMGTLMTLLGSIAFTPATIEPPMPPQVTLQVRRVVCMCQCGWVGGWVG